MKNTAAAQTIANKTQKTQVVVQNRYNGTRIEALESFQAASHHDVIKQIVHPAR